MVFLQLSLNPYTLQTGFDCRYRFTTGTARRDPAVHASAYVAQWRATDGYSRWRWNSAVISFLVALGLWAKLTTILLLVAVLPILLVARFGWVKAVLTSVLVTGTGIAAFATSYWHTVFGRASYDDANRKVHDLQLKHADRVVSLRCHGSDFRTTSSTSRSWRPFTFSRSPACSHGLSSCVCVRAVVLVCRTEEQRVTSHRGCPDHFTLTVLLRWPDAHIRRGAVQVHLCLLGLVIAAPALLAFLLYWKRGHVSQRMVHCCCRGLGFPISSYIGHALPRYDYRGRRPFRAVCMDLARPRYCGSNIYCIGEEVEGPQPGFTGCVSHADVVANAGIALYHVDEFPYSQHMMTVRWLINTVAFVRTNTTPESVIVSMKDIGFAADRRYFENYDGLTAVPSCAATTTDDRLRQDAVRRLHRRSRTRSTRHQPWFQRTDSGEHDAD